METEILKSPKERNTSMDFIKGISCIFVVFIHIRFPGNIGQIIVALGRAAVALFFAVSGYYIYYESIEKRYKKLINKTKRTAILMVQALLIYLIWECLVRLVGSGIPSVIEYLRTVFSLRSIATVLCFSHDPVVGHLWFLIALTEAYMLFMLLFHFGVKVSWVWTVVLLEIHIVCMSLSNLRGYDIPLYVFRSVWFYAMPCMILGYALHKHENVIVRKIHTVIPFLCIAIGCLLTLIERLTIGVLQFYNGTLLVLIGLFFWTVKNPVKHKNHLLTKIGREYSRDIYIYHWMVGEILDKVIRVLRLSETFIAWLIPLLTLVFTLIGVALLKQIQMKVKRNLILCEK